MRKEKIELIYEGKTRAGDILTEIQDASLQKVKVFGDVEDGKWHNMLIFGDNLQVLKTLLKMKQEGKLRNADGTKDVRLIYIDPPFGTGNVYSRNNIVAYLSKLVGVKYLEWLRQRVILLKELLSDNGSFYMRIDYHFGHYMKVLLDEIFGKENFRNEIVVNRIKKNVMVSQKQKVFPVATDSVLFYTKTDLSYLRDILVPRDTKRKGFWRHMDDSAGQGISKIFFGKELFPPQGKHWKYSQENIDKLIKQRKLRLICKLCGYEHYKGRWNGCPNCGKDEPRPEYWVEPSTLKVLDSNWTDIPGYTQTTGYPTENSEQLLERVIKASSNEGDIVLDAFAGSGTTGAVAEKLNRRWIMMDSSKFAVYTMIKRMLNLKEKIGNKGKPLKPKPFAVYNIDK